jgi:hypothetical protein
MVPIDRTLRSSRERRAAGEQRCLCMRGRPLPSTPHAGTESTDTNVAASPGEPGVEHPHGRGHVKQTPAAAAHGQETAASHKPERTESWSGSEPGSGKSKSAEHPAHPDPPRDAGNLLPAPAAEPESKSPPGKPSKWRLTAAPRPRPGSVLNPRISTVVGVQVVWPSPNG